MEERDFLRPDRRPAMFDPGDYIADLGARGLLPPGPPPAGAILCYQRSLVRYAQAAHGASRAPGALPGLHLMDDGRLAVTCGYGIGAPAAVVTMEELIALGCRRFVSIGIAGALQADVEPGDLVLCSAAFSDEGTSLRYGVIDRYPRPSARLSESLLLALRKVAAMERQEGSGRAARRVRSGASWTVDAAYRERIETARELCDEGVLTVEMEASALFTVAAYRGVEIAAAFTPSDSLADLAWTPDFENPRIDEGLSLLFEAALLTLGDNGVRTGPGGYQSDAV